ncbi:SAM-dependent methyltransferase [Kribbella aluminosa]|uniref:SAM-dependent methyltransferase n=1 Tax=Kribbella aluminosa TaxID=416017 RepID=A0ABS4UCP4_9ACTN|nr:class I SAM-dependent methyltransferase [Kribbella aluminosa]MBP2349397.1 SAM-dependent methyltransferase [Kribbella aluminosa]
MRARYDGLAEWYDERFGVDAPPHQPGLLDLLGPGSGPCLDLGCGTGRNFESIRASGRSVVGLDFSVDQLRRARMRTDGPLLHGDAAALPFADASFDTAITLWISTDVDDFGAADYLNAIIASGLTVEYFEEPTGPDIPHALAVRARKR